MSSWLLCLDTTTDSVSVALAPLSSQAPFSLIERHQKHATGKILPFLCQEILEKEKRDPKDIAAVALSTGPGSFTSLRIGLATAKGICQALRLPFIAIDTLWSMAYQAIANRLFLSYEYICPVLPMRNQTFAYALYDRKNRVCIAPKLHKPQGDEWKPFADKGIVFLGVEPKEEPFWKSLSDQNIHCSPLHKPSAAYLVPLARQAFYREDFEDIYRFTIPYLKDFIPKKSQKQYF